jgi:hypothetical protein
MMQETKYIIYEEDGYYERAIVFDNNIIHAEMANNMKVRDKVIGAGFVRCDKCEDVDTNSGLIRSVEFTAYGESVSLGVKSRGKIDSTVINAMFFGKE